MKLKEILFVTGQPGLFQYIAQGRGGIIVESLLDRKRTMLGASAKVSGLGDIAMYTYSEEEKPLHEILQSLYDTHKGPLAITKDSPAEELRAFMEEAVPGYDKDRVHNSDIKKLVSWYNLLVGCGMTDFSVEEDDGEIPEKKDQAQIKNQSAMAKATPKASSQSKASTPKNTTSRKSQ